MTREEFETKVKDVLGKVYTEHDERDDKKFMAVIMPLLDEYVDSVLFNVRRAVDERT